MEEDSQMIKIKGTVLNMVLISLVWVAFALLVIFGVSTVFPGCANNPVAEQNQVVVEEPSTVVSVKVVAERADTAVVTVTDQYGSEFTFRVWQSPSGTIGCDMSGMPAWRRWLKCMSKAMDSCSDRKPNLSDWAACVQASAAGCMIGTLMVEWMQFWCPGIDL
jgi:hypothetical protein